MSVPQQGVSYGHILEEKLPRSHGATAAAVGAAAILPGSAAEAQTPSGQAMSLQTVEADVGVSLDDTVLLACVNDHERR